MDGMQQLEISMLDTVFIEINLGGNKRGHEENTCSVGGLSLTISGNGSGRHERYVSMPRRRLLSAKK